MPVYVKLLEIRALWCRARCTNREEHLRPSNYIGLDIYFNSLRQICITTPGLSACGVSIFLAEPLWLSLFVQAKVNCPTNLRQV